MAEPATAEAHSAQPDITLVLDLDGVIQEASLSSAVPVEDVQAWIGQPWRGTVVDPGSAKVERMVEDARTVGVSAFRQVNQRFPSGLGGCEHGEFARRRRAARSIRVHDDVFGRGLELDELFER